MLLRKEEESLRFGDSLRGSVTVEAAVVLPIFLCVILSITFFTRAARTHEIMQHAIHQAALEMSATSYLFHVSGLKGVHDGVRDTLADESQIFREHLTTVLDAFDGLSGFAGGSSGGGAETGPSGSGDIFKDFKDLTEAAGEMAADPQKELKSIAAMIAAGGFEDLKADLCIPLARLYMNKYITAGRDENIDGRLRRLGIKDGAGGLDFEGSSFFEDETDDIEIVVSYVLTLPIPFKFFKDPVITQKARVRAWLGGDEGGEAGEEAGNDDIWSLSNFQRGRAIRRIFGANLPDSFPVISSYEAGTATLIKSMDITAKSYLLPANVEELVREYIDRVAGFKGQEEPWGSAGIVIRGNEIIKRELLLVIPGNEMAEGVSEALKACEGYALSRGVGFNIITYGRKNTGEESENGPDKETG